MKHSSDMLFPRSGKPQVAPPSTLVPILEDDRGPATFFHGREQELRTFEKRLGSARQSNGGTVFLIQGAPGAGKTALLHECGGRAEADGWRVAVIRSDALYDPDALAGAVGMSYATKTTVHRETGWRAGLSSVAALFRHRAKSQSSEYAGLTTDRVLKEAATSNGLVLVLDEVQTLGKAIGTPYDLPMTHNLAQIHNGQVGAPVILLAGGLGTSEGVFGSFGVTRFMHDCVCQLGRLSSAAERAVIRDWLVKAGGAHGDLEYLTHWLDTIAAECNGWPQHIQVYAPQAARWLYECGGGLTADVPIEVLAQGHRRKVKYYESRLVGLERGDRKAVANLLGQVGKGSTLEKSDLVAAFSGNRTPEAAHAVFQHVLHKGVVTESPAGLFEVPIPSMHTWLVQEYADLARTLLPTSPADETPDPSR